MAFAMSEELLPVFVPVIVYWIGAGIYHLTLCRMRQHQLFTKEEEETQNIATRRQVLAGVLFNQATQMGLVLLMFMSGGPVPAGTNGARSTPLLRALGQMAMTFLIMDCWEYFWHRWLHENKFLYKHIHAMHHHIIVPYSYGAQYVHPVDSLVGEIIGGLMAILVTGMSPRTAAVHFSLLSLKGLDDHCGVWIPNHPIHRWLDNNPAYHAIHHQHVGMKANYSVYFLVIWDKLLGTYIPHTLEPRKDGGYHIRTAKDE